MRLQSKESRQPQIAQTTCSQHQRSMASLRFMRLQSQDLRQPKKTQTRYSQYRRRLASMRFMRLQHKGSRCKQRTQTQSSRSQHWRHLASLRFEAATNQRRQEASDDTNKISTALALSGTNAIHATTNQSKRANSKATYEASMKNNIQ